MIVVAVVVVVVVGVVVVVAVVIAQADAGGRAHAASATAKTSDAGAIEARKECIGAIQYSIGVGRSGGRRGWASFSAVRQKKVSSHFLSPNRKTRTACR
jgi:hypothetical protein